MTAAKWGEREAENARMKETGGVTQGCWSNSNQMEEFKNT